MCVSIFFNFCEGDIGKSARFHARFDRPGLPRQGAIKISLPSPEITKHLTKHTAIFNAHLPVISLKLKAPDIIDCL